MDKKSPSGLDQKRIEDIESRLRKDGVLSSVDTSSHASGLEKLYATPKSFDDIQRDDSERLRTYDRYRSPYPAVKVAGLTGALFLAVVWLILNVQSLWYMGRAGIFFSFLFAIVIIFALYGAYRYVDGLVYSYGKSQGAFASLYTGAIIAVAVVGAVVLKDGAWSSFASIGGVSVVLFIVLWVILTRFFRTYHQL